MDEVVSAGMMDNFLTAIDKHSCNLNHFSDKLRHTADKQEKMEHGASYIAEMFAFMKMNGDEIPVKIATTEELILSLNNYRQENDAGEIDQDVTSFVVSLGASEYDKFMKKVQTIYPRLLEGREPIDHLWVRHFH